MRNNKSCLPGLMTSLTPRSLIPTVSTHLRRKQEGLAKIILFSYTQNVHCIPLPPVVYM